jgi:hypothetical protein
MAVAFRRNSSTWQVVQPEKCKNKLDFNLKMQKLVTFCTRGSAASWNVECRNCVYLVFSSPIKRHQQPITGAVVGNHRTCRPEIQ